MKINKLYKGLIVALVMTVSFSCSDEFLVEKPLSFLSPENTFIDAAGLNTALQRAYRGVRNQWNGDTAPLLFNHNMGETSVVGGTDKPDSYADLRTYANPINTRTASGSRTRTFYVENYENIKTCNTVIDNIDIPEWADGASDPERNHILGSAYFLRAWFYMQQTMQFGNSAFPLTVVSEAKRDFKVFHVQGIWDQMIADLEFAVQWMRPKSELPVGVAPKDAARVLLSKYYMLNERFADAEGLLDDIINGGESRLFTDADIPSGKTTVLVANNVNPNTGNPLPGRDANAPADAHNVMHENAGAQKPNNPEGIWLFVNSPNINGSMGRSARIRGWGPNMFTTTGGTRLPGEPGGNGIDTRQTTADESGRTMKKWGRSQGFARITPYAQYEVWRFNGGAPDEQDYRHKDLNWFEMEDALYDNPIYEDSPYYLTSAVLWPDLNNNGMRDPEEQTTLDTIRNWYDWPRFKAYAVNVEHNLNRQDGGDADYYIMRMGEVYLLRAEARAWQQDWQGAADDLNVIRNRANAIATYTAADVQALGVAAVLDERTRELWGEEMRHDELVRISYIYAKTGQTDYLGNSYSSISPGDDYEEILSTGSFYYNRQFDKNTFIKEATPWWQSPEVQYTMDPKHIFWPVFQTYLVGNVGAVLNQTTGYDGSEANIEPLTHVLQPAGVPNVDPQAAVE